MMRVERQQRLPEYQTADFNEVVFTGSLSPRYGHVNILMSMHHGLKIEDSLVQFIKEFPKAPARKDPENVLSIKKLINLWNVAVKYDHLTGALKDYCIKEMRRGFVDSLVESLHDRSLVDLLIDESISLAKEEEKRISQLDC